MYSSIYILSKVNLIMFGSFMIFIRPPWRLLVAHAPRRTTPDGASPGSTSAKAESTAHHNKLDCTYITESLLMSMAFPFYAL